MSPLASIHYSDVTHIEDVIVAITPIDSFTGQIIRMDPGDVVLCDSSGKPLLKHPVPNLSGKLVFTRRSSVVGDGEIEPLETELPVYKIKIDARNAGYFNPEEDETFNPATAESREIEVILDRLPSTSIPADATIIAGVVHKQAQTIADVKISAHFSDSEGIPLPEVGEPLPFKTRSDERGAFSLAIRIPPGAHEKKEKIKFLFEQDGVLFEIEKPISEKPDTKLIRLIKDGKNYSFMKPIEITGGSEIPELKAFGD